jgi:hypothetical protein
MPQFLFISKTYRLLQARLLPMTSILFGSEIPEPMTSLTVNLIGGYGEVWHPIVTNPAGRLVTLHSHCGNSGS